MKARAAVIALLVVFACALAWGSALLAPVRVEPRIVAKGAGADPLAVAGGGAAPGGAEASAPAPERTQPAAPTPARRTRITAVGCGGESIAGAEVRYWPVRSQAERERDGKLCEALGDVEAALRAGGRLAFTDADGCVEIEGDAGSAVCARSGELQEQAWLGSAGEWWTDRLRLELRRDVTLHVQVVDAAGDALAGRNVQVTVSGVSARRGHEIASLTLPPTDANGVTMRRHLLRELGCSDRVVDGRLVVAIERGGDRYPKEQVAVREVPWQELRAATHVRLVVDACGAMVVRLFGADGREPKGLDGLLRGHGDEEPVHRSRRQPDGALLFEGLPLRRRWLLTIAGEHVEHRVAVDGPVTVADMVAVDVPVPARSFELAARLVRADGLPAARTAATFRGAALPFDGVLLTADDRGCLEFGVWCLPAAAARIGPFEVTVSGERCAPRTFVLDRTLEPGKTDLGDIVVESPVGEMVLARVELRCDGGPVGNAAVWLRAGEDGGNVPVIERRTGAVIELLGTPPSRAMSFGCVAEDCVPVYDQPIHLGEHKVVALQRGALLETALLLPDVPLHRVTAVVVREGQQEVRGVLGERQQVLWFHQVMPGRCSLRIAIADRVVHESVLTLRAGSNRWPADGSRLDLRHLPRARCISARSARSGKRLSVDVIEVAPHATELPPGPTNRYGDGWFLPTTPPSDLLVRAEGHGPVRVVAATDDVVLQLQPLTEVHITAPSEGGVTTRMRLVDGAGNDPLLLAFDRHHDHEVVRIAYNGARFRLVPGTVVEFTVVRGDEPGAPLQVAIDTVSPQLVHVR